MMDIRMTVSWLREHGVVVKGYREPVCSGYIFSGDKVPLDGSISDSGDASGRLLLLNPIEEECRIQDRSILREATKAEIESAKDGKAFHPAVNARLVELTDGYSSRLQLESVTSNIRLAGSIIG
jgi:hypothetical protein